MSTEPMLEEATKIETSLEEIIAPVRIKPAAEIAKCFECEASQVTLTKYVFLATNEKILLCPVCARKLESKIERPLKLSKKERKKLRAKKL